MSQIFEVPAELYTPQGKQTIAVEVNWIAGTVSFWDPLNNDVAYAGRNVDFIFIKRGWFFTDYGCQHRSKPLTYKLTFYNKDGDKVRQLLDATRANKKRPDAQERKDYEISLVKTESGGWRFEVWSDKKRIYDSGYKHSEEGKDNVRRRAIAYVESMPDYGGHTIRECFERTSSSSSLR